MRNFVLLRKGFIGNDLLPGGTTVAMPDGFCGSPYMIEAPPEAHAPVASVAHAAALSLNAEQEICALKLRMASLESEIAARDERDHKIITAMEKLVN